MANATRTEAVVEVIAPATVTLTMNADEAYAVRCVLSSVAGPFSGKRGLVHDVSMALESAGVPSTQADYDRALFFGTVTFNDGPFFTNN